MLCGWPLTVTDSLSTPDTKEKLIAVLLLYFHHVEKCEYFICVCFNVLYLPLCMFCFLFQSVLLIYIAQNIKRTYEWVMPLFKAYTWLLFFIYYFFIIIWLSLLGATPSKLTSVSVVVELDIFPSEGTLAIASLHDLGPHTHAWTLPEIQL